MYNLYYVGLFANLDMCASLINCMLSRCLMNSIVDCKFPLQNKSMQVISKFRVIPRHMRSRSQVDMVWWTSHAALARAVGISYRFAA